MNAEPVRVSWQRTPDGTPLGKAHSVDAAGRLQSAMTTRWVKGCIAVETEVRTLHELLDQAVELGGSAHRFSGTFDPGAKVNGKVLQSGGKAPGATADFLDHREGPGVLCIDIDKKYQRDPWLTHEQVRAGLVAVAPWLEGVGLLVMDSSGSCIALDGQEVRGPGGVHAYALVDSAPMIQALLEDGHRRSYLAGLGKCIVSAGAGVLERSTFDLALRPPTQPDFVVPHLGSPRLSRSRPPTIFPGGRIPAKVELLSAAEVARYKRMADADKARLDPERRAKVEECAQARGKVAHAQLGGDLADHVAAARRAFDTQNLPTDFAIPLGNGKHLTVAELLADPSRVRPGWSLPDPLDPEYGPHRAKFDAARSEIISLAHGARRVYQLGARPGPTPDGSEPETEVGEAPVIDLSGADGEKSPANPKPKTAGLLARRPCDVARLREREHLQFVPLAELPDDHGMGEVFDEITGGGLAPGSLVGIGAAGTGAGKTALLMQALDGLALRSAIAAEDPEATVPLTPVAIFSEMAADDLEVRTLGRLLDVPGTIFAAGRSARRWHKWAWVDDQFNRAAALMQPGGTYHRLAAWQRYTRAGGQAGPSFVKAAEQAVGAWVEEIAARYPGREIVPVLAIDPVNSFLPLDGRSEVETLGELTALLDELADRRRWICAFTAETNKSSAVASGNGNTGGTAAAVFRGTMQLLHRCDLALVLEAGEPDPDGVRTVTLTFDKNRTGRTGVSTAFRWYTRTGLRFVAETEEERDGRQGADTSFPTLASLEALCTLVERLQAANEKVTDTKLRGFHGDIGVGARDVPRLILAAIERQVIRRTGEKARGGGNGPLATVPGWQEALAWRGVNAPETEPVQTRANR